jgi:hypothetical protein
MLLLTATTDKLQLTTSAAVTVDVHASSMDHTLSTDNVEGVKQNTAITTATTTDIVAAPASGVTRNVKTLHIRNKHASSSVDVTVIYDQNATDFELHKATLKAGEALEYVEGIGFFVVTSTAALTNKSVAQQGAGFAADTYLTGSNVPLVNPTVGTLYIATFDVSKTGAGIATPIIIVRVGTAGSTSDTARLTFTFNAGTANADVGQFMVRALFRTVGSGTSAVLQGRATLIKGATATTGLINLVGQALQVTSGGFDSTPTNNIIGMSYNGGTSAAHTVQLVTAELKQL